MGLRCGIDLGTTYSAISWYDSYNNVLDTVNLESADGDRIIRSVVYFPENGDPVVGEIAWNAQKQFPERVVAAIKRSMGADYQFGPVDGKEYTPQEISAIILKTLVEDASRYLGEEVTDAVITVPAYFEEPQRNATREAGEMAGLNVLELLPEPHAAALAYSIAEAGSANVDILDKNLLVYDLGGGTFDVTLIHATSEQQGAGQVKLNINTLCKAGNAHRGGLDWDRELATIVAEKVQEQDGFDAWADPKNEAVLLDNAEKAKRHLSRTSPAFVLADIGQHQAEVTQAEFVDRTANLLMETQMLLEQVLEEAHEAHGIEPDDIQIMLTGGSTRMPMVKQMIEQLTGRPPLEHGNPELLVTQGAAYWAHLLGAPAVEGEPADEEPDVVVVNKPGEDGEVEQVAISVDASGLTDISVHAVGVEVVRPDGQGGTAKYVATVLPAAGEFDTPYEKEFYKAEDGMKEIRVALYKNDGQSEDIGESEHMAEFIIGPLPDGGARGDAVRVTLSYDRSGIISGHAEDVNTGEKVDIHVDHNV